MAFPWAAGIGLLGGILGRNDAKKRAAQERELALEDKRMQFLRLRRAAKRGGFNPLTALGATGTAGFSDNPSGVAPLASAHLLQQLANPIADWVTGRDAIDLERQKVALDLDKLELEKLRAGGASAVVSPTVAARQSGLGRQGAVVAPAGSLSYPKGIGIAPGREVEVMSVPSSAGVFVLNNAATNNEDLVIPGDSEPWGIDELVTGLVVGGPQHGRNALRDTFVPGQPTSTWVLRGFDRAFGFLWSGVTDDIAKARAKHLSKGVLDPRANMGLREYMQ